MRVFTPGEIANHAANKYLGVLVAAKYARVDMDRESADFKVFELLIPFELEEQLLAEVEAEEPAVDPETGEMREPEEPELDQDLLRPASRKVTSRRSS